MQQSELENKILRALNGKRISAADMDQVFPECQLSRGRLIAAGLIKFNGSYYEITLTGRKHCMDECTNNQIKKPETIAMNQTAEIVRNAPQWQPTKIEFKERVVMNKTEAESKPRTLQVLEFIEKNQPCTSRDLRNAFDFEAPASYIKLHIVNNRVTLISKGGNKSLYSLAAGQTAESIYGLGVKNKGRRAKEVEVSDTTQVEKIEEVPVFLTTETEALAIKSLDAVYQDELVPETELVDEEPVKEILAINGKLVSDPLFAYTSAKTLMIIIDGVVIQLDRAATTRLREFYRGTAVN